MKILAIESSCDETAAAVTEGRRVLSSVVASQVEEHKLYGGVVPEIASRRHAEAITGVCRRAVEEAGCALAGIDAVAVTHAPGLIGALLVGVNFAKGLALRLDKPLIPVHHLRSHIAANYIVHPDLQPPFLCLLVSGGNSLIVEALDYVRFRVVGRTRDDAAGECFDKSARAMGMPYPGGVHLDKTAETGDPTAYSLPRPAVEGSPYDFSFSGLKTAVVNLIHNAEQKGGRVNVPDLSAAVRQRVCDMLLENTLLAARTLSYKTVVLAGGVSANSELRRRMADACEQAGYALYYPPLSLCGDNAAMVGAQAYYEYAAGHTAGQGLNAAATMPIDEVSF
ncbi:MAG: tRNA (adenosine(37)-N6)-threonylcarbamoyltransferase complex transferase subunit TsaD [Clostridiales bacterium]|nr:tRNA (adenosine(37)-N6)-threonylcarbamoyltransferase complex transferase subunit TsaD [Clostridiales bacterium]